MDNGSALLPLFYRQGLNRRIPDVFGEEWLCHLPLEIFYPGFEN